MVLGKKLNPKGGTLYDGIEVYAPSDELYHIGSRRLDEYESVDDKQYAEKIIFYLNKAKIQPDPTDPNGMVSLNQANFEKFAKACESKDFVPRASSAASAASAASEADADSRRVFTFDQIRLEISKTTRTPVLVYNGEEHEIKPNKPIHIKPETRYGVFKKLTFLESHAPTQKLTVTYVLKKTAEAYCAMSLFKGYADGDSSGLSRYFEYDFAIPSITQTIKTHLAIKEKPYSFGHEIIPIVEKINDYAADIDKKDSNNATNREYAVRGYEDADYIDPTTKRNILDLLKPRVSLWEQMSSVSLSRP